MQRGSCKKLCQKLCRQHDVSHPTCSNALTLLNGPLDWALEAQPCDSNSVQSDKDKFCEP